MTDCAITEAYRIGTSSLQELPILFRGIPELLIILIIAALGILIGLRMYKTNKQAKWLIIAASLVLIGGIGFYIFGFTEDCERKALFTTSNLYGNSINPFIRLNISEQVLIVKEGYIDSSRTNFAIDCRNCVPHNITPDKHQIIFRESGSAFVYSCLATNKLVIDMQSNKRACKDV